MFSTFVIIAIYFYDALVIESTFSIIEVLFTHLLYFLSESLAESNVLKLIYINIFILYTDQIHVS